MTGLGRERLSPWRLEYGAWRAVCATCVCVYAFAWVWCRGCLVGTPSGALIYNMKHYRTARFAGLYCSRGFTKIFGGRVCHHSARDFFGGRRHCHDAQRMEVERDDAAETESQRLGVVSFVRRGEALSGLFQQRYCDFHVHELERPGEAVQLCSLPGRADVPPLPDAAAGIDARVLQFVLYKENRTTSDALQQLASAASIPVAALRVAGTKDRRAITVQRCSWLLRESVAEPAAAAQQVARLLKINSTSKGSRVRVGHLHWAAVPLRLGDSMGNRFSVVLRELALAGPSPCGGGGESGSGRSGGGGSGGGGNGGGGDGEVEALSCACAAAVASVRACGFVNYFGLQRFGSGEGEPTHLAGAALLRGELLQAFVSSQ